MKRSFNEVLVPLDGSPAAERALPIAREVSERIGSALRLMSCAPPDAIQARSAYLDHLASHGGSTKVRTVVRDDESAARAISAVSGPRTLVCMSTHGRDRSEALLGSVAESVLREIQAPMLLVGPRVPAHAWLGVGRVVACIDADEESAVVLQPAADLARALDMPLWLTEVVSPDTNLAAAGIDVPETSTLARAAHQLGGQVEGWDVLHDTWPARALIQHAGRVPVSILVLAPHGGKGWHRLAAGSVTAAVVHEAEVPVLVVPSAVDAALRRPAERLTSAV